MLRPKYLKSFEKDVEKSKRRGHDPLKLIKVVEKLIVDEPLAEKYRESQVKRPVQGLLGMSYRT